MNRRSVAPPSWLVLLGLVALVLLAEARDPVRLTAQTAVFDPRFGAVEAFRARDQADAAGVRWSRLVFSWGTIQAGGAGSWNWGYLPDAVLRRELDSGRRVVGLLIGTPSWAGDGRASSVPRGLDLPPDDPGNVWATFARTMADHYRGRIDRWVIWNEPDIWDATSPYYTWAGSVEQFARLQKVGYLAIKAANPRAQVGLAGLTYWWDQAYGRPQYFDRWLDVVAPDPDAAANNWFFDAVVLHLYDDPRLLEAVPRLFAERLARQGLKKPVWINETNMTRRADWGGERQETEQARFVIQAFALALAAGADELSVYPFSDANASPSEEGMGLLRRDGSPRPAYAALRLLTRELLNVHRGQVVQDDEAVVVDLERDVGRVRVAWSTVPRAVEVTIPASAASARLIDRNGQETPLAANGGVYRLTLGPASGLVGSGSPPNYVGGDPLLVVEDGD